MLRCRRHRKSVGGGWRQAGILAAAAIYALEHASTTVSNDHHNAQYLCKCKADLFAVVLLEDLTYYFWLQKRMKWTFKQLYESGWCLEKQPDCGPFECVYGRRDSVRYVKQGTEVDVGELRDVGADLDAVQRLHLSNRILLFNVLFWLIVSPILWKKWTYREHLSMSIFRQEEPIWGHLAFSSTEIDDVL